jgi:hypothetical protein
MKKLSAILIFLVLIIPSLVFAQGNGDVCGYKWCARGVPGQEVVYPGACDTAPEGCTECVYSGEGNQAWYCRLPEQESAYGIPEVGTVGVIILIAIAVGGLFWIIKNK